MNRQLISAILVLFTIQLQANIWHVGPTRTYLKPSAVASLVQQGDTVEIDSGLYLGDCATWTKSNLLLRGTYQFAHLDANGKSAGGKAIWVISGNNVRVENIEFSGCAVADSNGAGIRIEGKGLFIRNCYFHNNENGMLGGSSGSIVVEQSEFAYNGHGDGYSHNIYINHADSFTLRFCYMHHANIGHEVKSRANRNYILYNRIMNEATGTASREIDLPNGGLAIIIGNSIEQGPNTQNSTMIGYGLEGLTNTVSHQLYIVNNTFVNERGNMGIFINIMSSTSLLKAYNNIFTGQPYTIISGSATTLDSLSNLIIPDPNNAGFEIPGYIYNLDTYSVCINKGTNPGLAGDYNLTPIYEYYHPLKFQTRTVDTRLDVGAYEFKIISSILQENSKTSTYKILNFPSDRIIQISSDEKLNSGQVMIYDISGKLIDKANRLSENTYEWNYSSFKAGVYLIKIKLGSGVDVRKIVVSDCK